MQILQSFFTVFIAGMAVFIAWQQWKVNQQKLKLDHYDRRFKTYEEVLKTVGIVIREAKIQPEALQNFRSSTLDAAFLFGPEIEEYIDEIHRRGVKLYYANSEYRDYTQPTPAGYDHQKVVETMHEQITWFSEQYAVIKEKFMKYLDLSKV